MDPVTVVKVAQVLKNKKTRKIILTIILIPIIFVLTITSFVSYILSHPLDFLLETIGSGEKIESAIIRIKNSDLNQRYSDRFPYEEAEYNNVAHEEITYEQGETKVIYYSQSDPAWGTNLYGTLRTIAASGCGPTSMAIVISSLTNQTVTPPEACNWSYHNGYLVQGYDNGRPYAMSSHALIPEMAGTYGLNCTGVSKAKSNEKKIRDALSGGKLVVAIMGKGHFTSGGHFIVLRGVTKSGKILVADCASKSRSNKEWDLPLIMEEARNGAGAGGPFWIISK